MRADDGFQVGKELLYIFFRVDLDLPDPASNMT